MTEPTAEALLEHSGFLRALARSLLLDEGQAEDVVQEAYLAAVQRPPPPEGARGWLAAVTRNLALKRLRTETRARHREAAAARERAHPATDDIVGRLELHRRLVDAVQRLDEPHRSAIVRRYFEDLPPRRIARDLGIPVRAIETRLRRGLERLRAELDATHAGDRRAWSLPLLALLPLPRSTVPATLAGVLVSKIELAVIELLDSLEKTGDVPPRLVGEIQRWNAQLVAVALKVDAAGVPGHGVNGSFTNPAVDVNVIHAMLKASGSPLTTEQEARLEEVGRRFASEEAQRAVGYPEGTLALRKILEEATVKDRFYAEVDGLLTEGQRDLLHPASVRGFTQLDLFSSGVMTYMEVRPLDMKDREIAVKQVTDKHLEKLGLDPSSRPIVEHLVRRWADRVAEAGLDAPREKNVGMPLLTKSERVRKVALLQLEMWDEIQRQVALTDEQRKKLAAETNILVPFR